MTYVLHRIACYKAAALSMALTSSGVITTLEALKYVFIRSTEVVEVNATALRVRWASTHPYPFIRHQLSSISSGLVSR